jgi:CBS domain-containing protein
MGAIMRAMGGGGHPGAGSAMLKGVNPRVVEEMIVELLSGNQFSSVRVGDLISFPVITVSSDTSVKDTLSILKEKGFSGVPVVDGEKLVGMISRRDFRRMKKESAFKAPVSAFMSKEVVSIEPGRSPAQAVRLMIKHDVGRLPVVEKGRLIGIIARSDLMHYFYDLLPA